MRAGAGNTVRGQGVAELSWTCAARPVDAGSHDVIYLYATGTNRLTSSMA
jgi:hypothetical protein